MLLALLGPLAALTMQPAVAQVLAGRASGDGNAAGAVLAPGAALLPGAASGEASAPGALITPSAAILAGRAYVLRDVARPRAIRPQAAPRV